MPQRARQTHARFARRARLATRTGLNARYCSRVKLTGFLHATIRLWFFTNDGLAGDIDKFSFCDLTLLEGLLQLSCRFIEGDDIVPDCLAAVLRIDGEREACGGAIISAAEPRVTTQPAA